MGPSLARIHPIRPLEYVAYVPGLDARTAVLHSHERLPVAFLYAYVDGAARRRVLGRIVQ